MLNDMVIDELINCPKNIVDAIPKNGMAIDKRNAFVKRRNFTLKSTDDNYIFEIFLRQNTMFIEAFSIGLMFKTEDKSVGKITLIRYNGEHGQSDWSKDNHYSAFHIHKITEKLLIEGIYEPKDIQVTNKFSTFDSALNYFLRHVNIKNFDKYFPHSDKQMSLFQGNEE